MLIGVLADTHIPDRTNVFPAEILEHFQGVDMILHAGDVCEQPVLDQLAALAPVIAVRGNRDGRLSSLPKQTVVSVGPWRIGLIHGRRSREDVLRYLAGDRRFADQRRYVLQAFAAEDVHCIVFGHTHHVCNEIVDGVLLFNPGGVLVAPGGASSSVGLLQIGDAGIVPHVIDLQHPPRPVGAFDRIWWRRVQRRATRE